MAKKPPKSDPNELPQLDLPDMADDLGGGDVAGLLMPDADELESADPFAEPPDDIENPLARVEYQENTEADSKAELDALQQAFAEREKHGKEANAVTEWMNSALDSEYWFCVCFINRAQKDEFLKRSGLIQLGDKYLDGRKVAKLLGVPVQPAQNAQRPLKIDKRYAQLATEET